MKKKEEEDGGGECKQHNAVESECCSSIIRELNMDVKYGVCNAVATNCMRDLLWGKIIQNCIALSSLFFLLSFSLIAYKYKLGWMSNN